MARINLASSRGSGVTTASTTLYRTISCGFSSAATQETTEANAQITYRTAGTLSNLWVLMTNNDRGASTYKVRINGADGSGAISIGASTTGFLQDTTNTDTVAAGDEVNLQLVTGAGGTTFVDRMSGALFADGTDTANIYAVQGGLTVSDTTQRFIPFSSDTTTTTTEANSQFTFKTTSTFKNFFTRVSANTRDGATTVVFRKNGADGNQTISVTSSTTGFFEDTSNTDSIVSDDKINISVTAAGTTGSVTIETIKSESITTNSATHYFGSSISGTVSQGTTRYTPYSGSHQTSEATENNVKATFLLNASTSNLEAYVPTNTASTTATVRLRIGNANGNQVLSITTTSTGLFEDTTNTDVLTPSSAINYQLAVPAGTGSVIFTNTGMLAEIIVNRNLTLLGIGI